MSYETDTHACASWERNEERSAPDPTDGAGIPYVCTVCPWTGRGGVKAFAHHRVHGHAVRGKNWDASWPDAQFSTGPVDRWLVGKERR